MPDILGAIGGALGLTGNGEVSKVNIQSWNSVERKGTPTPDEVFTAFINPDEFTVNYNVFVPAKPNATPGEHAVFGQILGTAPLEITLKFFLDGTGATGKTCNVAEQIQQFYKVMGYDQTKHSTRFLRIFWGDLTLLRPNQFALECVLKSATIQYKLFTSNGLPLRALITANFTEALSSDLVALEFVKSSPDLTHVRVVKEGETLPGLVNEIYGSFKYYLEVAKANGLKTFRNLQPGQRLFFPPFDKAFTKKPNG